MSTQMLYRTYLAIDGVTKALDACDVKIDRVSFSGNNEEYERYWRNRAPEEEVPRLYKYGAVQVYIESFEDYSISDREEREALAQKRREALVRDFVNLVDHAIVARYGDGQTFIWIDNEFDGFGVTINVGQALCERVLVGEEFEEVPDPEALEEAMKSVPTIRKVKPVFEWRCNDAELSGDKETK